MSVSDLDRHRADRVIVERYERVGYNFRMSDIQAALGVAQMGKMEPILRRRHALAERYNKVFTAADGLASPGQPPYARHNWQTYMLRLTSEARLSRDELMARLLSQGIASRRGVMAIHREPAYRDLPVRHPLTETERAADGCIVLPLFPGMTEEQQARVIEAMLTALR